MMAIRSGGQIVLLLSQYCALCVLLFLFYFTLWFFSSVCGYLFFSAECRHVSDASTSAFRRKKERKKKGGKIIIMGVGARG